MLTFAQMTNACRDHLMVQGNDKGSSAHFECALDAAKCSKIIDVRWNGLKIGSKNLFLDWKCRISAWTFWSKAGMV